jgi:hypothetical protein
MPRTTTATKGKDLVGCSFVIRGEGRLINYQGEIRGNPAPGLYLVQFFEAMMGQPNTLTIMPIEAMIDKPPYRPPGSVMLFEDDKHLRFWMENYYYTTIQRTTNDV